MIRETARLRRAVITERRPRLARRVVDAQRIAAHAVKENVMQRPCRGGGGLGQDAFALRIGKGGEAGHAELARSVIEPCATPGEQLGVGIVTGEPETLTPALTSATATPVTYTSPKAEAILAEDRLIEVFPTKIPADRIQVVQVERLFE